MNIPDTLLYTKDHEWARKDGDTITVGITDHAQEELTDIVFVELPEIGKTVDQGDPILVLESVKAASDIFAPVDGEVTEVNDVLDSDPSLVNTSPYEDGWIYKMTVSDPSQLDNLLSASDYGAILPS